MSKIMDMIYANSQCASIYYQMFCINEPKYTPPSKKGSMARFSLRPGLARAEEDQGPSRRPSSARTADQGDYMYVEMAHYTDDDKVVLICVTNTDHFKVHEYKLEKLKDKNWEYIIQRFCSGNSSDQILNNVETLFASLEFKTLVHKIYDLVSKEKKSLAESSRQSTEQLRVQATGDLRG